DPLVKPRSIAIVGATDRVGPARSVIESLGAIGFAGPIYPVNPKYQTVRNLVCYPSLTDLPEAPDVVVFSNRKPLLPEQVRLAVNRGARAAVSDHEPYRRLGRRVARVLGSVEDASRDRGERSRRDERGAGGLPRRAVAARQRNFGGHRLRRP